MYPIRCLKTMLCLAVTFVITSDVTAFGAVRLGVRNNRNQRTGRSSRPNSLSGTVANVQKALSNLSSARTEQVSAQRTLVQTRTRVNAKYDNSKTIAQVATEFEKSEAAHDKAKEKVLASLRKNDTTYQAALAKSTAIVEELKQAQSTGSESQVENLKSQAREQRLAVSSLEGKAFKNDGETQAAQRLLDDARRRIQALRKATDAAIAKDSELNNAKANAVQANRKVSLAQVSYSGAVANANAAAQVASAQAMRSRYAKWSRHGRGRHLSSSRFRRYR